MVYDANEPIISNSLFNSTLTAVRLGQVSGVYEIHTNMMHYPAMMQPTHAKFEQQPLADEESTPTESKHFPPLPSRVARNFQVLDVHMETPPAGISTAAYGKTVTAEFLNPFRGLGAVSDDIKDLLPPECRAAFDAANAQEKQWVSRFRTESEDGCRRLPIVDKAVVPFFPSA